MGSEDDKEKVGEKTSVVGFLSPFPVFIRASVSNLCSPRGFSPPEGLKDMVIHTCW